MIDTGSDFSGVGAFDQALERAGIIQNKIFACDMDKYARQTYCHNYGNKKDKELSKMPLPSNLAVALGKPDSNIRDLLKEFAHPEEFSFYYPYNVYQRKIPKEPLDIYMTSPPCQSFSLAGKRGGESDKRGTLFYNSHEFIVKNKPRYFIFENVKGLLSDDGGKTFQRWIDHLGGKTVNGNPVIFPLEDAVQYHVYHKVLNAKNYGVPQNRERIFIIGIRDDSDNNFSFPKPFHLVKRLKDVLEDQVDEKYYLSDKMINGFINHTERMRLKGNGFSFTPTEGNKCASAVTTRNGSRPDDNFIKVKEPSICAMRGINPENNSDRTTGAPTQQTLEINRKGTSNAITTVQKDNLVLINSVRIICEKARPNDKIIIKIQKNGDIRPYRNDAKKSGLSELNISYEENESFTVTTSHSPKIYGNSTQQRIRRLTPRECFRLMDFDDSFTWPVSDSQAYKQAGNSIVVNVLAEIIKKLNL